MRPHSFNVFTFNMRNSLYSRKRSSCREQFSLLQYTFEPHLLRQGFVIRYVEVIVSVARSTGTQFGSTGGSKQFPDAWQLIV